MKIPSRLSRAGLMRAGLWLAHVGRRDVDDILAHVRLSGEVLPADAYPVPEEAIRLLEGAGFPRP
jgi:hypothetical protein